ncbi:retrovirus-related pol polyprotein from transposon TNT 1-94 [Tanacetum coccineum]
MLCKPKSFYDEKHKVAIGYKNPLCLARAKQAQSALYNGHVLVTTNHTPTVTHDSEDTLELAEITRNRMRLKMQSPLCCSKQNGESFKAHEYHGKVSSGQSDRNEHLELNMGYGDYDIRVTVLSSTKQHIHRTYNGTEFVNQVMSEYYEGVGIFHQTSVPRTPQQNGVVERRNRTLVEAARTMMIFSKAPMFHMRQSCSY